MQVLSETSDWEYAEGEKGMHLARSFFGPEKYVRVRAETPGVAATAAGREADERASE